MNKKEALEKIKELQEYIESLDKGAGYKEDKLFLLSKEEYEKYKDVIPECKICWWLRSPGHSVRLAAYVDGSGNVDDFCDIVDDDYVGIRPVLKIDTFDYEIGKIIVYKKFPYTVIDKDLCIATVPINFDRFDWKYNNYETSKVREFLLRKACEKNEQ